MDSNVYDIRVFKNEGWNQTFTLKQDDGTAYNFTGSTVTLTVRDKPGGTTIATLTSGSGLTITAASGIVTVTRTASQLAAWNTNTAAYDFTVVDGAGNATPWFMYGSITLVVT